MAYDNKKVIIKKIIIWKMEKQKKNFINYSITLGQNYLSKYEVFVIVVAGSIGVATSTKCILNPLFIRILLRVNNLKAILLNHPPKIDPLSFCFQLINTILIAYII